MNSKRILMDTNVITAYIVDGHEKGLLVRAAITRRLRDGYDLCIAPQVLHEFYTVATRPTGSANGLSMKPLEAMTAIHQLQNAFSVIDDISALALLELWKSLVTTYQVSGRPAHDTRLVAWMLGNSVSQLMTLNTKDFERYADRIRLVEI